MGDRHQFRGDWHDYNNGAYFVTVCVRDKKKLLGEIVEGKMVKSALGDELEKWIISNRLRKEVDIRNYVIMPNHFHLLLAIASSADTQEHSNTGCLKPPRHGEPCENNHYNSKLAVFVGNLKGGVTRFAHRNNMEFQWQERYHEHIIRNRQSYVNIMNYIDFNVENWDKDCFNV